MSYSDVFGDGAIPLSSNSYQAITLSASISLEWSDLASAGSPTAPDILHIAPTGGGYVLSLPPGGESSLGKAILVRNTGAASFTLNDSAGGAVVGSFPVGYVKYIYLTSISTTAGTWSVVDFGIGTSTVDSATLAGYGLIATGATLSQSFPTSEVVNNQAIGLSDRGRLYVFTGASATVSLPALSIVTPGFFFAVSNSGTGTVTIDGSTSETIDGELTVQTSPGEALMVVSSTSGWFTVGRGRSSFFLFSKLAKSVAGGTDVTLTSAEAAHQMMEFTGVLTANINVIVPAVNAIYYVQNSTTGAYSLTVKTPSGTGIGIQQSRRMIVLCDSVNVYLAQDATTATVASLGDGSAGSPSLYFTSDGDTGVYRQGVNVIGFSAGGNEVLHLGTTESTFAQSVRHPDGAVGSPSITFSNESTSGFYRVGAGEVGISVSSTKVLGITSSAVKVADSALTLQDNADATKQAKFECSGITAGQTRTFTFPDASTTLVGTDVSQTLTNKTLTGGSVAPTTLTIPSGSGSTTEGVIQWDTATDTLRVGTGAATHKFWSDTNDGSGSGLDADVLDGMQPATAGTASTIMQRDASGDTTVRVLNISGVASAGISLYDRDSSGDYWVVCHNANNLVFYYSGAGQERVVLGSDGTGYFDGDVIAYYSDERLKDNVQNLKYQAQDVWHMRPVSFEWNSHRLAKEPGKRALGFIAQEVVSWCPEAVEEREDPRVPGEKFLWVNYEMLIPVAFQLIKDLENKVRGFDRFVLPRVEHMAKLEKRVDELEARLAVMDELETRLAALEEKNAL